MNNYELLLILPGTLAESEVGPETEKVKAVITENGGINLEIGEIDKRRLAYPIKHIRYGYFQLFYFQAEAAAVKAMENKLRMLPELLRTLIKKYSPKSLAEKKINFGMPTIGEEGRREETAAHFAPRTLTAVEAQAETISLQVQTEEKQKLEAAPVKKATVKKTGKKKVDLDEIDKKLDEILDMGLDNV